jgi:site-specific DNA-methyltransferase (adenine-specific)
MIELKCCDNLELLKELPDNHIDLIYSDILYGTGRNFGDYQDLKPNKEIIYKHYEPRIKEMYRVLKETGTIYLQMDYRINHWIRCILDDIFGYDNFRNEIVWKYGLGRSSDKQFGKRHDTILWYSKSSSFMYNKQLEEATSQRMQGEYKNMSDVWVDIPAINNMAKERIGYSTQKPKALIERIIKASSNENDLVADFYVGSGTTVEVCKDLNRNFIGCDISEKAIEISKQRIL